MDITALIQEYLTRREQGEVVDLDELVGRAGDCGPQLRDQLAVFERLEELARTVEEEPEDGELPERIGRFRILRKLGRGGHSRVFLAEDERLARHVALKVLSAGALSAARAVSREGRSLAKLRHPGVVAVHEIDAVDGQAYVAMEYVDGASLYQVLCAMRELAGRDADQDLPPTAYAAARALSSPAARCSLVARIARALQTCHEHGVVHRDIKPGNILLDSGHSPKLADFGLAHLDSPEDSLGHTQALVGTAAYVAPEQVDQERTGASPASDQFSLGVVLYELLTLENPFSCSTRSATMTAISRALPLRPRQLDPALPVDVERICLHALEREPAERYPDLARLAEDLESFVAHRPISLHAPSPARRARLWARRNRRSLGRAAGLSLVLLLASSLFAVWSTHQARQRLSQAREATRRDVAVCDNTLALADLYHDAHDHCEHSAELDRGKLAWLFSPLLPAGQHVVEECSRRLQDLLRAELEEARHDDERSAIVERFRSVLDLDLRFCPECPYNEVDRTRGSVVLAAAPSGAELTLWRLRSDSAREPVEVRTEVPIVLEQGVYRLRHERKGELAWIRERDFEARSLIPRWRVLPAEPAPEVLARMIPVPGEAQEEDLWIGTELVTWAEFAEVLPELRDAFLQVYFPEADWEAMRAEPADVPWDAALRYAAALGARLPLLSERWRAAEHGLEPGALGHEWTSTPNFEYRPRFPAPLKTPGGARRDAYTAGTGLRLCVSSPRDARDRRAPDRAAEAGAGPK